MTNLTDKGELWQVPPAQRLARIVRVVDRYAAMISPRRSRAGRSASESVRSIIGDAGDQSDLIGHSLVRIVGLCPPGTYVRLDSGDIAVVMRRSSKPNYPHVAIVLNEIGELLSQPRLHRTAQGSPQIRSALAARRCACGSTTTWCCNSAPTPPNSPEAASGLFRAQAGFGALGQPADVLCMAPQQQQGHHHDRQQDALVEVPGHAITKDVVDRRKHGSHQRGQ
jgi:hypothetical protein